MNPDTQKKSTEEIAKKIRLSHFKLDEEPFCSCGWMTSVFTEGMPMCEKAVDAIKQALDTERAEADRLREEIKEWKSADKSIQSAYKRLVKIIYPQDDLLNPFGVEVFKECEDRARNLVNRMESEIQSLKYRLFESDTKTADLLAEILRLEEVNFQKAVDAKIPELRAEIKSLKATIETYKIGNGFYMREVNRLTAEIASKDILIQKHDGALKFIARLLGERPVSISTIRMVVSDILALTASTPKECSSCGCLEETHPIPSCKEFSTKQSGEGNGA